MMHPIAESMESRMLSTRMWRVQRYCCVHTFRCVCFIYLLSSRHCSKKFAANVRHFLQYCIILVVKYAKVVGRCYAYGSYELCCAV